MIDSEVTGSAGSTPPSHSLVPNSPSAGEAADAAFWADSAHSIASYEAFRRDLPELMQSNPGWCVAYANGVRLGIARRRCREFYEELNKIDCDPSQVVVFT